MATFTINRKGGYETTEVDAYINSLEQQLKEYENKASAINKAIISAQMASDKMIKQANEETAAVIKKANEEAAAIVKKANEEKDKIMAEAQAASAALATNADQQLKDIRASIAKQKVLISGFDKEYTALVEKYLKSYDSTETEKVTKKLDEIDAMVSDWEKSGLPKTEAKPAQQIPQTPMQRMAAMNGFNLNTTKPVEKPAEKSTENPAPKTENPAPKTVPSPLTASSVPKPAEAEEAKPKQEAPRTFIKTGLAGGAGMGGIPANPSYGLGGERSLKNSVSHSEAPKQEQSAPEPVSMPSVNVPKFVENVTEPKTAENDAPKPGIYKVSADNHLYNDNRPAQMASGVAPQPSVSQTVPTPAPEMNNGPKPGIYKVSSDNKLYNDNTEA